MSNKELISYLRSFTISKEIFNIKIKERNEVTAEWEFI